MSGAWASSTCSTAKTKSESALLVDCGVGLARDPVLGVIVVGNLWRVLSNDRDSP